MFKKIAWSCFCFYGVLVALCCLPSTASAADLLKVKKDDGSESQLLQKVITVRDINQVKSQPNSTSKVTRIGPFNVFYQLKTTNGGEEENGYYRIVEDPSDKDDNSKIRWIKKEEVQVWATRFAIKPNQIDKNTTFKVNVDKTDGGGQAIYDPEIIPKDATAYSFVLESDESDESGEGNGDLRVALCTARVEDGGTAASLNQLGEMALEVCFVIEDEQYLTIDYKKENREFRSYIAELAAKWADMVKKNSADGDIPVKMALVSYNDIHGTDAARRPEIVCPLTSDLDQWVSAISRLTGREETALDTPTDGLSGLNKAVNDLDWGQNSAKQIVVLANGPLQRFQGKDGGPLPINHYLNWLFDRRSDWNQERKESDFLDWFGSNTSGKSEREIVGDAYQLGGNQGEALRRNKYIHTVHVGYTTVQMLDANLSDKQKEEGVTGEKKIAELKKLDNLIAEAIQGMSEDEGIIWIAEKKLIPASVSLGMIRYWDAYDEVAQRDLKGLAQNNSYTGYYTHMDPEGTDIDRVVKDLGDRIESSIALIRDVSRGKEEEAFNDRESSENEMTTPIFRIVGSELSATEIIQKPVRVGLASLRDSNTGRSVGEKVVMVSDEELARLEATLDAMFEQFQNKRKSADRQNIKDILDGLKKSLVQAATGQEISAETKISALITDLPLRTEALRLTAGDLAVMSTDAFDSWLEDVQLAKQRSTELKSGDQGRWISINGLSESKTRYAFLRLSELP